MEQIGKLTQHALNAWTGMPPNSYENSQDSNRDRLIRQNIRRTFISAGHPMPDEMRMPALVGDARRLWADIPDDSLLETVEEAIKRAGGFPASNGLVAKVWDERNSFEAKAEIAQKLMREANSRKYLGPVLMSPETAPSHPAEAKSYIDGLKNQFPFLNG